MSVRFLSFACLPLVVASLGPAIDVEYESAPLLGGITAGAAFNARLKRLSDRIVSSSGQVVAFNADAREIVDSAAAISHSGGATVGVRAASFLSSRLQPVDADLIRESLHVTEPLRSPAQGGINIIMKEDVGGMSREAKYKGMQDQAEQLKQDFEDDLVSMRGGA